MFETTDDLHYTCPKTEEMQNYFGSITENVSGQEASLLRQLEDEVVNEHQGMLYSTSERLAELDALSSFAEVSAVDGYVRPRLQRAPVLFVKGARHPLQEVALSASGERFIANDVALAPGTPDAGPVALITGPNGSGKSVYLRTVGLLPILCQAGCFVPAQKCVMGLVDRVFTRIASLESASAAGLSSFTIDVNAVGAMCRYATERSLLLIDEFGKASIQTRPAAPADPSPADPFPSLPPPSLAPLRTPGNWPRTSSGNIEHRRRIAARLDGALSPIRPAAQDSRHDALPRTL